MENVDGALGFRASIDIKDFEVSAEAMENHIKHVSNTAINEGENMQSAFDNVAKAFVGMVGINAAKNFVQQVVNVRSEMQNTEASFKVFLGSAEKAKSFFSEMQKYAYNNVFEFADLTKAGAQLLSFRNDVEDVIPIIDKLSNIAAGVNVPLAELVSLFNKAKANDKLLSVDIQMWESRGVPIVYELAQAYGKSEQVIRSMVSEGKIGFNELNTVISNLTNEGGMFAGMMEEKMKTLGDSIGLLQDNITNMFNSLGEKYYPILKTGIDTASSLVENYEEVGRILGALVKIYGTYKAAVIATSLAQKGNTGIGVIDNTVRSIKITLLKAEAAALGKTKAQQELITAVEKKHIAELENQISTEQRAIIVKRLRAEAISQLLTQQQAEYMSNLGLTTGSANYEIEAMKVLTVEQQLAVKKIDLTTKNKVYVKALENEIAKTKQARTANLEKLRTEREEAKQALINASNEKARLKSIEETARYELYWAKQSGDASKVAIAREKLEVAQSNLLAASKTKLAATSRLNTATTNLQREAHRRNTTAIQQETVSTTTQTTVKNLLTLATARLTTGLRTLWATMRANPLGWLISLLGLAYTAFSFFKKSEEEATDAITEWQNNTEEQISKLKILQSVIETTSSGTKTHKESIEKVNQMAKEYNTTLLIENDTLEEQREKYDELTNAIRVNAKEKALAQANEEAMNKLLEEQKEIQEELEKSANKATYTKIWKGVTDGVYRAEKLNAENIRNAQKLVWDLTISDAQDAAKKLQGLMGNAYTQTYNKLFEQLKKQVQKSTKASDEEIKGFEQNLKKHFDSIIKSSQTYQSTIEKNENVLESWGKATPQTTELVEGVNYATMSYEELNNELIKAQKTLEELNKKKATIPITNIAEWQELVSLISKAEEKVQAIQGETNTENGINARIKALKDEKANVDMTSARYKELQKEIQQWESKLSKNSDKTAKDYEKRSETLRQKQRDLDAKLEEERISVMEEGYEKRKALLDLQHKKNLQEIDRQQDELVKVYKESGKTLSESDKAKFNQMRDFENQKYYQDSNKLFDGEIEYKKQQYELYFNWVRNVGEDVANKHFENLLKEGKSFEIWVDSEIAKLKTKQLSAPNTFTKGDAEALNALKIQQNEIKGIKSAMDLFKESLTESQTEAETLKEKFEALLQIKEQLNNGEFHLNADEALSATVEIENQTKELQKELKKLSDKYKDFAQQRADIEKKYNDDIALLEKQRLELLAAGEIEAANKISSAIAKATKDKGKELISKDLEILKDNPEYIRAFEDLKQTSTETLQSLLGQLERAKQAAAQSMNPEDLREYSSTIQQITDELYNRNPFKALADAQEELQQAELDVISAERYLQSIRDRGLAGSEEEIEAQKMYREALDRRKKAENKLVQTQEKVIDKTKELCDSIQNIGSAIGGTTGDIISFVGELGLFALNAVSSFQALRVAVEETTVAVYALETATVVLAIISAAFTLASKLFQMLDNDAKQYERSKEIYESYIEVLDKVIDRHKELMKTLTGQEAVEQAERVLELYQQQEETLRQLGKDYLNSGAKWNSHSNGVNQRKNINNQAKQEAFNVLQKLGLTQKQIESVLTERMTGLFDLTAEQLKYLQENASYFWAQLDKDVQYYLQDIIDNAQAASDYTEEIKENLTGLSFDSLVDDFKNSLYDMDMDSKTFAKKFSEYMRKAMINSMVTKEYEEQLKEWYQKFSSAMSDSVIDEDEQKALNKLRDSIIDRAQKAVSLINEQFDISDSEDAVKGAIASLSEETGGIIAGRLNAVIINQSEQNIINRNALIYQAQIAQNTAMTVRELKEIKAIVNNSNGDSCFLPLGITDLRINKN